MTDTSVYEYVGGDYLIGRVFAPNWEGWLFDPRPLSDLP